MCLRLKRCESPLLPGEENDGFPLPATAEEQRKFERDLFVRRAISPTPEVETGRRKPRSRPALPELSVSALRSKLQQLPSPTKPKFLDRLITSVGLSKKCSPKSDLAACSVLDEEDEERSDSEPEDNEVASLCVQSRCRSRNPTTRSDPGSIKPDVSPTSSHPPSPKPGPYPRSPTLQLSTPTPQPSSPTPQEGVQAFSTPTSPIIAGGLVRQRLLDFQRLALSPGLPRCRSVSPEGTPLSPTIQHSRSFHRAPAPLLEEAERLDRCLRCFYSVSRDELFSSAVMSKGYVKAVVEQINQHKFGCQEDEENGEPGQEASEAAAAAGAGENAGGMGKETENRNDGKSERCRSPSSPCPSSSKPAVPPKGRSVSVPLQKKVANNAQHNANSFHGRGGSEGSAGRPSAAPPVPPIKVVQNSGGDGVSPPVSPAKTLSSGRNEISPPLSPAKVEKNSVKGAASPKVKPPVNHSTKPRTGSTRTEGSPKSGSVTSNGDTPHKTSRLPSEASEGTAVGHKEVSKARKNSRAGEEVKKSCENGGIDPTPAELFDMSWSESEFEDEFEDEADLDEALQAVQATEVEAVDETPKDRLTRIAEELLATERAYVTRLKLLNEDFRGRLLKENQTHNFMPMDVIKHMFSSLESIFNFHHGFQLPELEERMKNWENERRIGDLMKGFAPFLKLYTDYVKNFDGAMNLINHWTAKSSKFANIIHEVQKQPASGNLSLQHHMLEPIQRVPRYELLLKDYLKYLPEDSSDRKDAQAALDLVTKAASHSNEAMKKIEKFRKLLEIHQSLRGISIDFISPTRELVREGSITKISARSGEKQARFLFLFNDLLLICGEPLLGAYRVKAHLDVDGMEMKIGANPNCPDTFCVMSRQKSIEFLDENPAPNQPTWIETVAKVIEDFRVKKMTRRAEEEEKHSAEDVMEAELIGERAPRWIPDDMATACMRCEAAFSTFRRRHHCRACGWVVCSKCCQKAPLAYMNNTIERVCTKCYDIIVHRSQATPTSPTNKKGLLQVKADEAPVLSGFLSMSIDKGKSWMRRWFSVQEDFVLYSFHSQHDTSALTSLPLPGMSVEPAKSGEHVFKLYHKSMKKAFLFQADCDKDLRKWVNVLRSMARLELPVDNQRLSTQSSSSTTSSGSSDNTVPANSEQEVTPTGDQPLQPSSSSASNSDPSPSNPDSSDTSSNVSPRSSVKGDGSETTSQNATDASHAKL